MLSLHVLAFLAIFCFTTSSDPSVTTGQNELDTTTALEKRMAEMEEKMLKLQRDNKGLTALLTQMQRDMNKEFTRFQIKENLTRHMIVTHIEAQHEENKVFPERITHVNERVKKLEEKEKKRDLEAWELQNMLKNLTSKIDASNRQLFEFQNSCTDDPPSVRKGKAMNFERKHGSIVLYECDTNYVMTGNSTVRCELGKWIGHQPACSYFDATFYTELYIGDTHHITCYSDSNAENIQFSRVFDTGTGEDLPRGAQLITSKKSVTLNLSAVDDWRDKFGAFRCAYRTEEESADAVVPFQYSHVYFQEPSEVANVGDSVRLRLVPYYPGYKVVWRRDGRRIHSWDGLKEVTIQEKNEEVVLSARYENETIEYAVVRISTRRCKANFFGKRCDQVCPVCYNGGICHDLLGVCVCPEGFVGSNCEKPCPKGFHGPDCSRACGDGDCRWRLFCKQHPFGCSCATGFKTATCWKECDPGWYGANCRQQCHCSEDGDCSRFTGECSEGCASGWKGLSCQIRDD